MIKWYSNISTDVINISKENGIFSDVMLTSYQVVNALIFIITQYLF